VTRVETAKRSNSDIALKHKLWRMTKISLLTLVAIVLVAAGTGAAYRSYRQDRNAELFAIRSPPGISEGGFVKIGGIDQFIQIRGDDTRNPVLLVLHGGPGSSYVPATSIFLNWEKYFTVVQWDQRGTGRSYGRDRSAGAGEMTIERMVQDGIEVAKYARQRLHKDKIILYGTSWGTILGTAIAARRPDLLYAYVGSGQVVDARRNEEIGYATLLRSVRQAGDARAIAALTAIGPPPYKGFTELGIERHWFYEYVSPAEKKFMESEIWDVIFHPYYSIRDIIDDNDGLIFSIRSLFKEALSADLESYTKFQVPFIVIDGAEDTLTPPSLVKEYLATIDAPEKKLIMIPGGGHLVSLAMPDQVLAQFLTEVRPLAVDIPATISPH